MGNCVLEILEVQADFGEIPEVGGPPVSKKERRMGTIAEIDFANLKEAPASYLAKSFDMCSGCEAVDKKKSLAELGEIGKLHANAEWLGELNDTHEALGRRISVSDNRELMGEKNEMQKRKESAGNRIAALRKSLRKSDQMELVNGATQLHEEAELETDRSGSHVQYIGGQELRSIQRRRRKGGRSSKRNAR